MYAPWWATCHLRGWHQDQGNETYISTRRVSVSAFGAVNPHQQIKSHMKMDVVHVVASSDVDPSGPCKSKILHFHRKMEPSKRNKK